MKKIKMARGTPLTFEEGCKKYLENCKQRNLREGTIGHYRQSYTQFYKLFNPKMPIEDIDEQTYKDYVLYLKSTLDNDVSINSYLRDLITFISKTLFKLSVCHYHTIPICSSNRILSSDRFLSLPFPRYIRRKRCIHIPKFLPLSVT